MKLNLFGVSGLAIAIVFGGLASGLLMPTALHAQSEEESEMERESRWGKGETKAKGLVLTRRANNNAYGTSAFSFRTATQDLAVHRNHVDLVFNGCGLLHFNPVGGMRSRVCDLG